MRIVAINGIDDGGRPIKWAEFAARSKADAFAFAYGGEVVETEGNPSHLRNVEGEWVIQPRPQPRQSVIDYDALRTRFNDAEKSALVRYLRGVDANGDPRNPLMLEAYEAMMARGAINLDSTETVSFFDQLVADGVLPRDRRAEILS
jgi:hypothetical protein